MKKRKAKKIVVEKGSPPEVQLQSNSTTKGPKQDDSKQYPRLTQELLKSERDKLLALLEGLARTEIGIHIVSTDYKIHFQNQMLIDRFGLFDTSLCYQRYMGRNEPCDFCPVSLAISNNKVESVEFTANDGRSYRILSAPFPNPDGTVDKVIEVVIDITEPKASEEKLRESEQLFRSIVENSHAGIFTVDNAFRFTYVNDRLCQILGYLRDEIIGHDFREFLDKESKQLVTDRYIKRQKGQAVPSWYGFTIVQKSGTLRNVELSAAIVRDSDGKATTVGQILDITERKKAQLDLQQAHDELEARVEQRTSDLHEVNVLLNQEITQRKETEEKLRQNEAKYRDLVESANSIILEFDLDGNITFFNRFAQEFFDYKEEEIVGRNILGTIVPEVDSAGGDLKLKMADLFRHPELYYSSENENMRSNGERVWVAWTNKGVYNEQGALCNILSIGIDRTEQKRTAEMLAEQERETIAAFERNRLARDLHDAVSQTLFSASLVAEVLPSLWEKDVNAGRKRLEEVRELTRGALAEMRTLLLELRPAALADAELGDLLRQLAESINGRARVSVSVQIEGQSSLSAETKIGIYRIAQEALNNVAKHSGASNAMVILRCQVGRAELCIRDNGEGFDLHKIPVESLGLGIMRERAKTIGAYLDIKSKINEGTEVTVICQDLQKEDQP